MTASDNAAGVAAGVLVVTVTVAVDPAGLAPFGPVKWAVVTTGVTALAALVVRRPRAKLDPGTTRTFLALGGWLALATVLAVDPTYAAIGTPERHLGLLAWGLFLIAFTAGQALSYGAARTASLGATVAGAAAGAWAIAELLGWQPVDLVGTTGRPGGPFGQSAYLGAAAVLFAPVAIGAALERTTSRRARAGAAAAATAATVALVASGARAAWLAALVILVVTAVARRRSFRRTGRVLVLAAAGTVAVIGLAFATGVAVRPAQLATSDDGGARGRLDEWRVAARVVAERPIAGTGPEGYRIVFGSHVDEAYERAHGREPLPDRAHSAVLDVAATGGIPAALLYVALLALIARHARRALVDGQPWLAGIAAGVAAYFVQSMLLFPVPELDAPAWLLAGILVTRTRTGTATRRRARPALTPLLASAAAVALVLGALDVLADRRAARILSGSGNAASADAAAELRPDAVRYWLVASRAAERARDRSLALRYLDRAADVSPLDPVVRRERARILLDRARSTKSDADVAAALTTLLALAEDDPVNAQTQLRVGLALALAGNDEGAEAAWLRAEHLAPTSAAASTNLAIAYARLGRVDDARAAANRALARDPDEPRAAQVLAEIGADGT